MFSLATSTDVLQAGVAAAGHRDLGIPVVIAVVALIAMVLAFVQVLWVWPGRARRPRTGADRAAGGRSPAGRGKHRR